jgi:arabinose-5-phosphate isomerase
MTSRPLGAACVLDSQGRLAGLITDGDVRRALRQHDDIRGVVAADVMTVRPAAIAPGASVHEALRKMEDRGSQISVLPVVDEAGLCVGLLRLHDLYQHQPSAAR